MNKIDLKKIVYYFFTILVVFVIIFNLLSIFNLSFFGYRVFKVGSGSMRPYLNVGDVIIVKKEKKYNVNDIITYSLSKKDYVTHRIIFMDSEKIVTKGDNNNVNDKPINYDNVVGKVAYRLRIIPLFLSNPIMWILLFLIGIVLVFLIPQKEKK